MNPEITHAAVDVYVDFLNRADDAGWDTRGMDVPQTKTYGTVRKWVEAHKGMSLRSVQVTGRYDGVSTGVWAPDEDRVINNVRSSSFQLNDSRQEFAGTRMIGSSETTCMFAYKWGDSVRVVHYRIV